MRRRLLAIPEFVYGLVGTAVFLGSIWGLIVLISAYPNAALWVVGTVMAVAFISSVGIVIKEVIRNNLDRRGI